MSISQSFIWYHKYRVLWCFKFLTSLMYPSQTRVGFCAALYAGWRGCFVCTNTLRFCQLPPPRESWSLLHAAQAIPAPPRLSHQSCSTRALQTQILFRINLHLRFFDLEHHDKSSHFPINHLGTLVTSQNGQRTVSQSQPQSPALRKDRQRRTGQHRRRTLPGAPHGCLGHQIGESTRS
jgi:hypothetical protein